ncbi:MAG: hypothetical protein KGL59_08660 [Acidobacteriota bacterium]|nr:hypothetical protein [Acidobacteriota bacterium]
MRAMLLLLLATTCAASAHPQKDIAKPLSKLTLTAANAKSTLGSDVWIQIHWTNTSDRELTANRYTDKTTGQDMSYTLDFRDSAGRPVPKLPHKPPVGHFFDAQFGTLKPGQQITNEINLRRMYDLSRPGKYTLQVSRRLAKSLGGSIIRSNTLAVTITK